MAIDASCTVGRVRGARVIGGHERKKPGLCAPPALSFFGGGHMSGMAFAAVAPTHVAEVENKIAAHDAAMPAAAIDLASLDVLASNLQAVWSAPTTDARLKTRIVRTLIHEVVADTTTRPPRSSSLFTGWAAPTAKCTCPSVGADSATASPPISLKRCVNWCSSPATI